MLLFFPILIFDANVGFLRVSPGMYKADSFNLKYLG